MFLGKLVSRPVVGSDGLVPNSERMCLLRHSIRVLYRDQMFWWCKFKILLDGLVLSGKSSPETIDFPIKIMGFLRGAIFPSTTPLTALKCPMFRRNCWSRFADGATTCLRSCRRGESVQPLGGPRRVDFVGQSPPWFHAISIAWEEFHIFLGWNLWQSQNKKTNRNKWNHVYLLSTFFFSQNRTWTKSWLRKLDTPDSYKNSPVFKPQKLPPTHLSPQGGSL